MLAALCILTACGPPGTSSQWSSPAASASKAHVNPARISRTRGDLPPGYEVDDVGGPASAAAFWGFGPGWTSEPPRCAVLAAPATDELTTKGWSASGPGGIVHTVVSGSPAAPVTLDPAVPADCGHWTISSGNTNGTVDLVDAPAIDGATTIGMHTVAKTVVEGGRETTASAYTFNAYLDDYLTSVTVVTDPGSPNPPLGGEFAADLLVKTVSALRG
ncbi:hypothetical protein A5651_01205 [Mycobacterium sp. 1274761.0]|nr:hypothetical protein A5651_01205 [Mycobacterium sp. 1274761.0]